MPRTRVTRSDRNVIALPLEFVVDAFRREGWTVEYLGAPTDAVSLIKGSQRVLLEPLKDEEETP